MSTHSASPLRLSELPFELRQALESGECVLFVGAGIGGSLSDRNGHRLPYAPELATEIAAHFGIDTEGNADLAKVSQIVEIRKRGRNELNAFLQKRLADITPNDDVRWLSTRPWRAIFTTNYDNGIERAYDLNPGPIQIPVVSSVTTDVQRVNPMIDVPIYHLHGALFGLHEPRVIITEHDYSIFRERRRMLFDLLKKELLTSTILYIGYSHNDENWKLLLSELIAEIPGGSRPTSYRIAPHTPAMDKEILRSVGVLTLDTDLEHFVEAARINLATAPSSIELLKPIEKSIPSDFRHHFEASPAATVRLVNSWIYVNQAPLSEGSNLARFLKGDKPNWTLIAQGDVFERDVEEEVYDELLDYATSSSRSPSLRVLLGPAGFGMSTLLYTLVVRLVKDRAGPVFMLKAGSSPNEGDVLFACSMFPDQRPYFVVDNAADFSESLNNCVHRLRDTNRPAMFLMAERINEWRLRGRLNASENVVEALSDPEIWRLLAYLEKHGELGTLEGLKPDLRFAAIKKKHGKQLLVVMREAIEDNSFDAILEDEYKGMTNDFAKRLYLIVCCFSQHGALLRDSLLADLLGETVPNMHKLTADATEGVVVWEVADSFTGTYFARARHRTIAAVVWERCGDILSKQDLLLAAMRSLNLNYRLDVDAFEQFIRSDKLVDGIRTFEDRTRFFEIAIQKDPASPYVRQHYARMLTRSDKPELALSQIEKAVEIDPSTRILYHTKGIVLSDLAIAAESVELARRRMVQAEQAFNTGLNIYEKDEYCYTSLARLYLDWAKKVPAEGSDYIAKSEAIISKGLKAVANKERLWVASADIQAWLGDKPGQLQDLERAIREEPKAIYSRFLISRAYRMAGEPLKAIEKLEPVLKENPEEFRLCIEYAMALEDLGKPYSESIAILRLGSLYGLRDPRFISIYAGMLFMNGDLSDAARVFTETAKREINFLDSRVIHYRPKDRANPKKTVRLSGKVVQVKAGYAFIEVAGYSRFLCPNSRQAGITLREKMPIEFEPAFSSRNAIADNLRDPFSGSPHRRPV